MRLQQQPVQGSATMAATLSPAGLGVLVACQILPQIDFSIVNVALDPIGHSLGAAANGLVLVVAFYALAFATLLAAGGRLGDRYGRKRLLLAGIAGFGLASGLCGLAGSLPMMLFGRLLQGACGALLMPQILATIHASLHGPRHRRAVGIYTAIGGLSVAIGQILGGWLVSADFFGLGWRLGFFVNLPICAAALILALRNVPDSRGAELRSLDFCGMGLFAAFLLCLLLPVAIGGAWPAMHWLLLGLVPAGLALWRVESALEARGERPLMPPSLFRVPGAPAGFLAQAAVTFCYSGFLFVTALCLQRNIGFSPQQSGDSFGSLGLMFFLGSMIGKRQDNGQAFVLGAIVTVAGFAGCSGYLYAYGRDLHLWQMMLGTGLVGLGNAFMLTSAYRIILSNIGAQHAGEASAAVSTMQQGCYALGTAVAATFFGRMLGQGYPTAFMATMGALCLILLVVAALVWQRQRPSRVPVDSMAC